MVRGQGISKTRVASETDGGYSVTAALQVPSKDSSSFATAGTHILLEEVHHIEGDKDEDNYSADWNTDGPSDPDSDSDEDDDSDDFNFD